ncbi:MAG: APC family permease [Gammaproteobacteria bacterium]|nr:APC family permease [Gammaproteobacteria bacterium]
MEFERILKRHHVVAFAFGAIMGWSWVLLTGLWIGEAGTLGAALAFAVAGIGMVLIALTYAELASAMPKVGGEHVYTLRAFGPHVSFVCTWALLLGYVSVVAFEVVALPFALSYLFPAIKVGLLWQVAGWDVYAGQIAIGIAAALVLTTVNVWGISTAARLQGFVTVLILLSGAVLISGASFSGGMDNMTPLFENGLTGTLSVLVMIPILFVGFDVIPQAAEEIDLPPARIGALVVFSVTAAAAFYVLIVLAVGYVLDPSARAQSTLTTADAAVAAWSGTWAGTVLVCGGIAGIITSWNAFLLAASRLIYALASSRMLPSWLARLDDKHASPARALWLICAISCVAPWFGRSALVWLVNAGSVGVIIAYAVVALAFIVLRRQQPDLERPYRVPFGPVCGWLAFAFACAIATLYLPWSPAALLWPQEWMICGLWALGGAVMYLRTRMIGVHAAG